MKRLRATIGAALAALALCAAGCGGSTHSSTSSGASATAGHAQDGTVVYGALPAVGTPLKGGTVSFAELTGGTPTEVFPLTDGANTTTADFELNGAMYLPLYNGPVGATPSVNYALSVARPPSFSDGDRTATIPLRQGVRWSNGAPVDANDVLFYLALLKAAVKESAANWAQFIPGQLPQNITAMSAPNRYTVVLHLNRPYNPEYFLNNQLQDTDGGVYPLPSTDWNVDRAGGPHLTDWENPAVAAKIYNYLSKAGTSLSTFATNPLWKDVDGAFTLKSFSTVDGAYDLVPNPSYSLSPKPSFANLSVEAYTSNTSALNALRSGAVDIVPLDASQLGETATLRSQGVSVFGAPSFGWFAGIINFKDRTDDFDHVIAQRYVRAAIEHMVDQPALIKGVYKNAAAQAYGPVGSAPASPFAPADAKTALYPYDPSAAVARLRSHGWKVVPGGQTTCAKPGTAAGECGAGIPAGTPLKFTWASPPASVFAAGVLDAESVASIAKQAAGINIAIQIKSLNFVETNYNDTNPDADKYSDDWGALTTPGGALINDYYPTQAGYDSPGTLDFGDYNEPAANRYIDASVHSGDLRAVEREAGYLTRDLPDFYLPNPDELFAVSHRVGGSANSWLALTEQSAFFPQYWYRTR